ADPLAALLPPRHHGGGSGLLVTEELVRAVRTESAVALKHWFGVSTHTVWCWRRTFGVGRWDTDGSKLLHQEVSERGADAIRGKRQSEKTVRRRVQTRRERGCPPPNPSSTLAPSVALKNKDLRRHFTLHGGGRLPG